MAKGSLRSYKRAADHEQPIYKRVYELDAVELTIADGAAGKGFGSIVLDLDLPEGNIVSMGGTLSISVDGSAVGSGLSDTWNGDAAVGVEIDANGTHTADEYFFSDTDPLGPAVAGVSGPDRLVCSSGITGQIYDNTGGAADGIILNISVDDADISEEPITVYVTGTVDVAFIVLGDD